MPSVNRVVMQRSSRQWLEALPLAEMDAAEVSGKFGMRFTFRSYNRFRFPKYDICEGPYRGKDGEVARFDLVLANQVWEHLDRPYAATRNVLEMLRPGGYFWVAVPFYIPYHGDPVDCSRWSARGLKNLLIEAGFEEDAIRAQQWGNRSAAMRNFETPWPPPYERGRDVLTNEPDFPICSWALAQKK
ncbi:MAG: methyltransferase domain-containing protein [Pseudomonadota bacterium]|uniref:methyltransferase domain-containing protein n=2 Tax=Roseovarius TaxID=74030 RepID=UPI0022A6BE09|nr:methyltransferase domain-containing protein [Roseovarius sp. EGI FJ00037]MCZ0810745.1 methyltransferase domain-containing protein [Roseovarius sp. EGI FJ00037]